MSVCQHHSRMTNMISFVFFPYPQQFEEVTFSPLSLSLSLCVCVCVSFIIIIIIWNVSGTSINIKIPDSLLWNPIYMYLQLSFRGPYLAVLMPWSRRGGHRCFSLREWIQEALWQSSCSSCCVWIYSRGAGRSSRRWERLGWPEEERRRGEWVRQFLCTGCWGQVCPPVRQRSSLLFPNFPSLPLSLCLSQSLWRISLNILLFLIL